jgi:hypothetical protein
MTGVEKISTDELRPRTLQGMRGKGRRYKILGKGKRGSQAIIYYPFK